MTIGTLGTGALAVDRLIERAMAIESDTHLRSGFPVDVVLIEGLGILSEDNITVVRGGGTRQAESIAPEILFLFVGAAISLFFIGGAFDAQAAIRIAFGLSVGVVALWDV